MEAVSLENLAELEKRYGTTVMIFATQILSAVGSTLAALFLTANANDSIPPNSSRTL